MFPFSLDIMPSAICRVLATASEDCPSGHSQQPRKRDAARCVALTAARLAPRYTAAFAGPRVVVSQAGSPVGFSPRFRVRGARRHATARRTARRSQAPARLPSGPSPAACCALSWGTTKRRRAGGSTVGGDGGTQSSAPSRRRRANGPAPWTQAEARSAAARRGASREELPRGGRKPPRG